MKTWLAVEPKGKGYPGFGWLASTGKGKPSRTCLVGYVLGTLLVESFLRVGTLFKVLWLCGAFELVSFSRKEPRKSRPLLQLRLRDLQLCPDQKAQVLGLSGKVVRIPGPKTVLFFCRAPGCPSWAACPSAASPGEVSSIASPQDGSRKECNICRNLNSGMP